MTFESWSALILVSAVFVLLGLGRIPPYLSILAGVVVALVTGLVGPSEALAGFANEGVITIAALFVVAAGLNETGAVASLVQRLLGHPKSAVSAQARLIVPVSISSAFLNNTPIVAILMPVVSDWARRINTSASQLLMPLSFAAILGGLCTLIGTSTNLVVHGLLLDAGEPGLGFFQIARVGVPCAIAGLVYIIIFARVLLPRNETMSSPASNRSTRSLP